MNLASLQSAKAAPPGSQLLDQQASAFRDADFLSIMLTEITNQDPLAPAETSKLVENMRQLQELANARFQKYRGDLTWAQNLVGQSVTVMQANVSESEAKILYERGLQPDVGYREVQGTIETYRVMGETVWLTIGGKDYPIDNLQRIEPAARDQSQLATLADSLLGRRVGWIDPASNQFTRGRVDDIRWTTDGSVMLRVDGQDLPFDLVRSIGLDE